jgi:hypothetical protein
MSAAEHQREDTAHDVDAEPRLARQTRRTTARDAAAAADETAGPADLVGRWGPVQPWPVVGVHTALLPDGRVLAFDSVADRWDDPEPHDHTRATVWDPATGTHTPVNVDLGFNIFCSGLAHLIDGSVFAAGGNRNPELEGIRQTHVFNPATNTWRLGPTMAVARWYPSVTPLPSGELLITEGGPDVPEIATRTASALRSLPGGTLNLQLSP